MFRAARLQHFELFEHARDVFARRTLHDAFRRVFGDERLQQRVAPQQIDGMFSRRERSTQHATASRTLALAAWLLYGLAVRAPRRRQRVRDAEQRTIQAPNV